MVIITNRVGGLIMKQEIQGIKDGEFSYSSEVLGAAIEEALAEYTFKDDKDATNVLKHSKRISWDFSRNQPKWLSELKNELVISLNGYFTREELLALIHFHPEEREKQAQDEDYERRNRPK